MLHSLSPLARKLGRPATIADLAALPPNVKGEIIDGELYVQPRPRSLHAFVEGLIVGDLTDPYHRGRRGPGGWWILPEPGIEVPGSTEFSPDVAGWRRERMPKLPANAPIVVVPDWICEVLSPGTRSYDTTIKRPFYARIGVKWLWYADLEGRTVTVRSLSDGRWLEVAVAGDNACVQLEPFPAVALDLAEWWSEE